MCYSRLCKGASSDLAAARSFGTFILRFCELVGVVGPLPNIQVEAIQQENGSSFISHSDSPVVFAPSTDGVSGFIRTQGSYSTTAAASLNADAFDYIVASLGVLLIELPTRMAMVRPEHDCQNSPFHDEPLLCLPYALAALWKADFVTLVLNMRSRFESKWSASTIDAQEAKYRQSRSTSFSVREFKSVHEQ